MVDIDSMPPETDKKDAYLRLLSTLNRQTVEKHDLTYARLPWDEPEMALSPEDPRHALGPSDPLVRTAWYQSVNDAERSCLGLHCAAQKFKVGLQFENILKRGLLEFIWSEPDGSPDVSYAYHEVIEECQHSLMFQEFVDRTGLKVQGMPWIYVKLAPMLVRFGRTFPEYFFLAVLAGEEVPDAYQKWVLKENENLHPIRKSIYEIHVSEESRHIAFAKAFLKKRVPELSEFKRRWLALAIPLILSETFRIFLTPGSWIRDRYRIPVATMIEAYKNDSDFIDRKATLYDRIKPLIVELNLITPLSQKLWKRLGLGPLPC